FLLVFICYFLWSLFFLFTYTADSYIYTLSLHDALPIFAQSGGLRTGFPGMENLFLCLRVVHAGDVVPHEINAGRNDEPVVLDGLDRKSTRLNSSHVSISYAVFCLKKKK